MTAPVNVPFAPERLAERDVIDTVLKTFFDDADRQSFIALRVLDDNGRELPAIFNESVRVGAPDRLPQAYAYACEAANHPTAAVFAPPLATFSQSKSAREQHLVNGLALSVECDSAPREALARLTKCLGEPTMVVASGGKWLNPDTDELEGKLHLHWKLANPTADLRGHVGLRTLRSYASDLVGSDATNKSVVHPIRWPGSWHRKKEPTIATIVSRSDAKIDLEASLQMFRDISPSEFKRPLNVEIGTCNRELQADLNDVAAAVKLVPNVSDDWNEWGARIALAIWAATGGSIEGFEIFNDWSSTHPKYDQATTEARWNAITRYPPDRIGFGTLVERARDVDPNWRAPSWDTPEGMAKWKAELDRRDRESFDRNFDQGAADRAEARHEADKAMAAAVAAAEESRSATNEQASESPPSLFPELKKEPEPPRRLKVESISSTINPTTIPSRRWLIKPRLPMDTVTQCVGEPAISKSTFALRDALIVVTGRDDLLRGPDAKCPERLHRCGPAIVYNAEDSLAEMKRRLAAAMAHYGIVDADLRHPIHLVSGLDETLILMRRSAERGPLAPAAGAAMLRELISETKSILVFLDPQVSLAAGAEENATNDMNDVSQLLATMASDLRVSIVVVHHTAKATRNLAGDMGAGRGSFTVAGKVRSQYTLCGVTDADKETWGFAAQDDLVRVDYGKNSYDKRAAVPLLFRRCSVSVGNGDLCLIGTHSSDPNELPEGALLRVNGDTAPVIEFAGLGIETEKHVEAKAAAASEKAIAVANAVLDVMKTRTRIMLADEYEEVAQRLIARGVSRSTHRQTIVELVSTTLCFGGVETTQDGYRILVRATRDGVGPKSPWILVKAPVEP